MGSFSLIHLIIAMVMVAPLLALVLVPTWRILRRAGFSGWWSLVYLEAKKRGLTRPKGWRSDSPN
jgi:hypothetical protein